MHASVDQRRQRVGWDCSEVVSTGRVAVGVFGLMLAIFLSGCSDTGSGRGPEQRAAALEELPTPLAVPASTRSRAEYPALFAEPGEGDISHDDEVLLRELCLEVDWEGGLTDGDWGTVLRRWSDDVEGVDAAVLAKCGEGPRSDDDHP